MKRSADIGVEIEGPRVRAWGPSGGSERECHDDGGVAAATGQGDAEGPRIRAGVGLPEAPGENAMMTVAWRQRPVKVMMKARVYVRAWVFLDQSQGMDYLSAPPGARPLAKAYGYWLM